MAYNFLVVDDNPAIISNRLDNRMVSNSIQEVLSQSKDARKSGGGLLEHQMSIPCASLACQHPRGYLDLVFYS